MHVALKQFGAGPEWGPAQFTCMINQYDVKEFRVSGETFNAMMSDNRFVYVVCPEFRHAEILKGCIGTLGGIPLTTDAYDSPENRRYKLPGLTYMVFWEERPAIAPSIAAGLAVGASSVEIDRRYP